MNLMKYYAAVGVLEDIKMFLKVLQKRLPSFFVGSHERQMLHKAKKNPAKDIRSSQVDQSVLDMIRKRNHADIELYDFAKEIFEIQLQRCGF